MITTSSTTTAARRIAVLPLLLGLLVLMAPPAAHADPDGPSSTPLGKSWIRAGHFVPGMGATEVDLTALDGASQAMTAADGVSYGESSDYRTLAPGEYTATVRQVPATSSEPLLSRSFEIAPGDARTLAVVGTAAAPRLVLLADDLTPPNGDSVRVRVLAAASNADGASVTAIGGPVVADSTALGQATDYATVPAGSWTLEVESDETVAATQTVQLVSGSVYTAVLLDDGTGLRLSVLTDAAGSMVTPRGGAATGRSGAEVTMSTADPATGPNWLVAGGLLLVIGLASAATRIFPYRSRR